MDDTAILNWLSKRISYLEIAGPNGERCVDYFPEVTEGVWPMTAEYAEENDPDHPLVDATLRTFVMFNVEKEARETQA